MFKTIPGQRFDAKEKSITKGDPQGDQLKKPTIAIVGFAPF
ncbi:hypothetical protein VB712_12700 [Spirulina sp. CCNP1310]|nr:hypothetical protein [Spirulina sp. CCNP1310]MEA5420082.1 hypothetical protein [Spirulina sp. CCNP1310]